jgi:hypothetical protein
MGHTRSGVSNGRNDVGPQRIHDYGAIGGASRELAIGHVDHAAGGMAMVEAGKNRGRGLGGSELQGRVLKAQTLVCDVSLIFGDDADSDPMLVL